MAEAVKRASDIEEATNRWIFHPLSTALVPYLARLKVTPNIVSLAGMGSGVAGGLFYRQYQQSYSAVIIGFGLMCVWHILDGADGQLARLTNTQSEFGKIVDGVCDYGVFATVYIGLGLIIAPNSGAMIWLLVFAAAVCHAIQSGAYETQRQMFDYFALAKPSASIAPRGSRNLSGTAGIIDMIYAWIQVNFSGFDRIFYHRLEHAIFEDPKRGPLIRTAYRRHFAPVVHKWSVLCANYRTYAIFLCCLIRKPEFYFMLECTVLMCAHVILILRQKSWNRQFQEHYDLITNL